MAKFPNFHVTVTDDINDVDEAGGDFDHYCLLFAGRLNYFGTATWEQHALTHYKRFFRQCKNKNIRVTCKFIVYENDEPLSGHVCNRLSGLGNIYQSLFNTIENFNDITQVFYPEQFDSVKIFDHDDINKYNNIVTWLESNSYNCEIKKDYFERYCKYVFGMADNMHFYYVNSDDVLIKIQTVTHNQNIKSVYGFGQHFQVVTAYSNDLTMFDDVDDNTLVIKVRYDCAYFSNTTPELFKNVFYSINNNDIYRNFFLVGERLKPVNFNIYQLPTVMYTRMRHDVTPLIHNFPHDMSLIFNKEGIKYYAKHYTDYILNQTAQVYNINDKGLKNNYYLGLNIHASLGAFFNENNYNVLDYTPINSKGLPINVFGELIRDIKLPNDQIVTDTNDDYKMRWYSNYESIKNILLEKFGKHNEKN